MIKFVIMGVYALLMLVIGVTSMKKANTLTAFVVGGRKAGAWLSAFAYGTTYFSAVIFIGYAGRSGWDLGLWAVLIGVGNAFFGTWLAWKLLAERTRSITTTYKIKTMPAFFEKRYDSKGMKIFAAVIIFVFMAPYSASVYSGLSYFCESVLGVDYTLCMLIIAALTAMYLVMGGYLATLLADLVQGFIMLIGVFLMIKTITGAEAMGGFLGAIQNAATVTGQNVSLFDFSQPNNLLSLIALVFLTSFGTWALPQTVHKFYAVKDKQTIKTATIISTGFSVIISCGAYFVGSLTRIFYNNQLPGNYDMLVPDMLNKLLPEVLLAVIFVLVLSASMSTLSSLVLASSSAMSMDLIADTLRPGMERKQTLLLTRLFCVGFIALSFVIAATKTPILMLMSFSWGAVAGSFMGPFLLGLFDRRTTKAGAWAGMLGGFLCSVVLCVGSGFNSAYASLFGMIAMVLSVVLTFVVSRFTKPYTEEFSDQFFDLSARQAELK